MASSSRPAACWLSAAASAAAASLPADPGGTARDWRACCRRCLRFITGRWGCAAVLSAQTAGKATEMSGNSALLAVEDGAGVAVLLNAGGAQPAHAMALDQALPGQELVERQRVAPAGLLEADQAQAHARHDLRLAADHPAF